MESKFTLQFNFEEPLLMVVTDHVELTKNSPVDYVWSGDTKGTLIIKETGMVVTFSWMNGLSYQIIKLEDMTFNTDILLVDGTRYYFLPNPTSGEIVYINALRKILVMGNDRPDRTGVGTRSIFGLDMTFDLSNQKLPMMTQRKISWKNILAELLFFIRGQTDANILRAQGVNIWNGNGSREFLDKIGLKDREEYDLGPVYGWQWRYFGAKYVNAKTDYTGQGFDQLQFIIDEIKKNPQSRRLFVCAWNVTDLDLMALPPCHHSFQFYVEGDKLSCLLGQRSGDMVLGIPYNIASYAALTHIVAEMTGLKAHSLKINIGDAHIYRNHISGAVDMISKETYPCPKLIFTGTISCWDDVCEEKIELQNYQSGSIMKFDMAV